MLSYWEKKYLIGKPDYLVVGAGIIGSYTALNLKKKFPNKSVLVIDNGVFPNGASTKNAGFTCFGSPGELLDDLKSASEKNVIDTIQKRYEGIQEMMRWCDPSKFEFVQQGSLEVFISGQEGEFQEVCLNLNYLNELYYQATGVKDTCKEIKDNPYGFGGSIGSIQIQTEGKINTGLYIKYLHSLLKENQIDVLMGCSYESYKDLGKYVDVSTSLGSVSCGQLFFCTNAFASQMLDGFDVKPARAQVLVTEDIGLNYTQTFHQNKGYNYFRTVDGRILLGGARDKARAKEETFDLNTSNEILSELEDFLHAVVYPSKRLKIEYAWAGIMGVGPTKEPLVGSVSTNVHYGVRMGGMGVAIGASVGRILAGRAER